MEQYIETLNKLRQKINLELIPNIDSIYPKIYIENPWFSRHSINLVLKSWVAALSEADIDRWLLYKKQVKTPKKVGVIAAGNIPLVGLHDFLSVIASGHYLYYKKSQGDQTLIDQIFRLLVDIDPRVKERVFFVDKMKNIDAVIATGSNNTSRYFEYYFSKVPNVIRKNRTSLAILTGDETDDELRALSEDVFSYFGLGCRNVAKVFLPSGYDIFKLLPILEENQWVKENTKYMNNYDYNRAILMMNLEKFYDTGNLILVDSQKLYSNVSMLNYQFYNDLSDCKHFVQTNIENIQCVVSNSDIGFNKVELGQSQFPRLWNYADNVNVLDFLINI